MSLVAYGASDDSDTSDVEESEQQAKISVDGNESISAAGHISDDDDYVPTAKIEIPSVVSSSVVSSIREGGNAVYTPSTLSDLPAPKTSSTAGPGEEGDGEDELEEEVKPKPSQLADAPKPPPKKTKAPARIVLPALNKGSDDEDEEGQKKSKPTPAAKGLSGSLSGLFALLPPPVHATKKQTNRPLIPHTLTKRPTISTPTTSKAASSTPTSSTKTSDPDSMPSKKHQSAFNALTGYESDSDEEEGEGVGSSFFSFGSKNDSALKGGLSVVKNSAPTIDDIESSAQTVKASEGVDSSTASLPSVPSSSLSALPRPSSVRTAAENHVSSSSSSTSSSSTSSSLLSSASVSALASGDAPTASSAERTVRAGGEGSEEVSSSTSVGGVPMANQDAPLTFSSSSLQSSPWASSSLSSPMVPEMYAAAVTNSGAATYWQQQQHYAQDYGGTGVDYQGEEHEAASSSSGADIMNYMQDEQFQRISGKRKRGQEDIKIIDANVDDYVDPSDLMKGISEESSYQSHRKKDNMPSTQQRRKKQITYLAFQAKERELDLKNQWSQNRMTKNQARSKYGF